MEEENEETFSKINIHALSVNHGFINNVILELFNLHMHIYVFTILIFSLE